MRSWSDLRVGMIPYLNARPFWSAQSGAGPAWVIDPPRCLGERAAAGQIDVALLASRDALALAPDWRPLSDLGISRRGAVDSVLLFSDRPVDELSGKRIALTDESRTSRALLRILLAESLHVSNVDFVEARRPAHAELAIGDSALALREARKYPHELDLGECWTRMTGLPFVYARWVVRRDVPEPVARRFAAALTHSLAAPVRLDAVRLPAGFTRARAQAYLDLFSYRLGPSEERGLARFHDALARNALLNHHRHRVPIETAA